MLAEPRTYRACIWDLMVEHEMRHHWLALFRGHFPTLLEEAAREAAERGEDTGRVRRRTEAARAEFFGYLDAITADPDRHGSLGILDICIERERALRHAGIDDPYRLAKQRENKQALGVLPGILSDLDAMEPARRWLTIVEGILAGNIFDLGATETAKLLAGRRVDFHATRQQLRSRPWFMDNLDAWIDRLDGRPHRAAVLFVDNAGPDILLGMIPFARELLARGTRVILTANSTPSLNDVTYDELLGLIEQVAVFDSLISAASADGQLKVVPSGNGAPLIDLTRVSPRLVAAVESEPVDLVVLEGMGRAVETNLDARFTCEALKLAMIKEHGVAAALGAVLYDLVMRYEPAMG